VGSGHLVRLAARREPRTAGGDRVAGPIPHRLGASGDRDREARLGGERSCRVQNVHIGRAVRDTAAGRRPFSY